MKTDMKFRKYKAVPFPTTEQMMALIPETPENDAMAAKYDADAEAVKTYIAQALG